MYFPDSFLLLSTENRSPELGRLWNETLVLIECIQKLIFWRLWNPRLSDMKYNVNILIKRLAALAVHSSSVSPTHGYVNKTSPGEKKKGFRLLIHSKTSLYVFLSRNNSDSDVIQRVQYSLMVWAEKGAVCCVFASQAKASRLRRDVTVTLSMTFIHPTAIEIPSVSDFFRVFKPIWYYSIDCPYDALSRNEGVCLILRMQVLRTSKRSRDRRS